MKKQLLLLCLLFVGISLSAQNFQIGIDGGVVYNSKPAVVGDQYDNNQHRSATGALDLKFDRHKWQYGVNLGYRINSFSGSYYWWGDDFPGFPPPAPTLTTYKISQKEFPLKFCLDRKITFNHLETYIGPFLGFTFATSRFMVSAPNEAYPVQHYNWLIGGVQVGGIYFLTKRLGINVDLNAEYNAHSGSNKDEYPKYSFPATIGIRYRL